MHREIPGHSVFQNDRDSHIPMPSREENRKHSANPSASHGSGGQPYGLAKFSMPQIELVYPRKSLLHALDQLMARSTGVWVTGVAGSGKTTLAASYLARGQRRALWYSLDRGDSDPATFFHYLREAVAGIVGESAQSLPPLTAEYLAAPSGFARNFFRQMYMLQPGDCTIVLDNYQELDADSPMHGLLAIAMEEAPAGIAFLVLSREAPPAAFARLQANQVLAVFGNERLALTREETAELVALYCGHPPDADALERLYQRTRGWAAGVVLMLQSNEAERQEDAPGPTPAAVFDYFATQVLAEAPSALQEFLLQTAVLPTVQPELAASLTGDTSAASYLAELRRRNLFVMLHPGKGHPYVYHPLFRDFLLRQAASTLGREKLQALRQRAGTLLAEAGETEAAIELFLEADEPIEAGLLIERVAPEMLAAGRYQPLTDWIGRLPPQASTKRPWLRYWLGMARLPFDIPEARAHLEKAYSAFRASANTQGAYLSLAAILESYAMQWDDFGPVPGWMAELDQLQQEAPISCCPELEPRLLAAIVTTLSLSYPHDPRLHTAVARLEQILHATPPQSEWLPVMSILGMLYIWMGRYEDELELINVIRGLLAQERIGPLPRLSGRLAQANFAWAVGDASGALEQVAAGLEEASDSGVHILDFILMAQGCYATIVSGQTDQASEFLAQIERGLRPDRRLDTAHFHYQSAYVAVARGDLDEALAHAHLNLEQAQALSCHGPVALGEIQLAQILGLAGRIDEALDLVERVAEHARPAGSTTFVAQLTMIRTALLWQAGDMGGLLETLPEALAAIRTTGFVGPLLLVHQLVVPVCQLALLHDIETDFVKRLIRCGNLTPVVALPVPENWPYPLRIEALGTFRIRHDDESLDVGTKASHKPLELLKALIALGGEAVSTTRLADALWPDADGDTASQNLRTTLHRLRKLLGPDMLQVRDGQVSLDRKRCYLDVWVLQSELARAETDGGLTPGHVQRLLALYPGPLLADCELSVAIAARETLRSRYLRTLERLAKRLRESGKTDLAIACYEKGLEVDPLAERFYQGLMRCYLQLGRPAEGLAIYARCEQILDAELGVAPSAETQALRQKLIAAGHDTA